MRGRRQIIIMDVILYSCNTPPNYIYKYLDNGETVNCKIQDDCNLLDPVLLISNVIDIAKYNYAHIPGMSRYYFINEFSHIAKGVIKAELHIDVLRTYAKEILNTQVYLTSSQLRQFPGMTNKGLNVYQQNFSSDFNTPYDVRMLTHTKIDFSNPKHTLDVTPTNILIGVSSLKA